MTKTVTVNVCPGYSANVTTSATATLVAPSGFGGNTVATDGSDAAVDPYRCCNGTATYPLKIVPAPVESDINITVRTRGKDSTKMCCKKTS